MIPQVRPLLECRGLAKRYLAGEGGFELAVPELSIRPGELVLLKAPSGAGKSTLLDLLAMVLEPDSVQRFRLAPRDGAAVDVDLLWSGRRLDRLDRLRGAEIGYVLQVGGLLPYLSVRENIQLAARLLGRLDRDHIDGLCRRLGIHDHLAKAPAALSVGERQRVAIARALAHRPRLLLADEPTASLDPITASEVMQLLLEGIAESGTAAVVATHDWDIDDLPGARLVEHRLERQGGLARSVFRG